MVCSVLFGPVNLMRWWDVFETNKKIIAQNVKNVQKSTELKKWKKQSMLKNKMIQKRNVANWYIKTIFAEYFVHICIECRYLHV